VYSINSRKYCMRILLGDFDAKIGMECIFTLTVWNGSLHEINIDSGVKCGEICHIQKPDCQKYNVTTSQYSQIHLDTS
jgi:hypothetical protein